MTTTNLQTLPFQRLAHMAPKYRWWKPLAAVVLSVVFWLIFSAVIVVTMVVLGYFAPDPSLLSAAVADELTDMTNPWTFAFSTLTIAVMMPAVFIGVRLSGRRVGYLSSVAGRIRWGLAARYLPIALIAVGITAGGTILMNWWSGEDVSIKTGPFLLLQLVLIAFLVPLQSLAEEYVFRSLAMQTIGAWLSNAWWAILLPLPLFIFGHEYNWVGLVDVGFFALAAAWVTWKTGGIEAAGVLHVVNNCIVFICGVLGLTDINATEMDFSPMVLLLSIVPVAVYAIAVVRIHASCRGKDTVEIGSSDSRNATVDSRVSQL